MLANPIISQYFSVVYFSFENNDHIKPVAIELVARVIYY